MSPAAQAGWGRSFPSTGTLTPRRAVIRSVSPRFQPACGMSDFFFVRSDLSPTLSPLLSSPLPSAPFALSPFFVPLYQKPM